MKLVRLTIILLILILPIYMEAQNNQKEDLSILQNNKNRTNSSNINYLSSSPEEILKAFDNLPSFGIYKDNYFITGIPTNKKVSRSSADAKFQISIRQRLVNVNLPFNSYLFLTYTQKSFWDVYDLSSPFADNNYNPGLLWTTPLLFDNFRGVAAISVEHESNGKGGEDSRGWNYVSISGSYFITDCFSAQLRLWYGWGLDSDNRDLNKYKGYGLLALSYRTKGNRFWSSFTINPCKGFRAFNTVLEVNFKISTKLNQYLFIQWHNGYCENLLEYDKYCSMVRIGICLKPPFRNIY